MSGLRYPFEEDPATGDLRRAEGLDSIRSNVRGIADMGLKEVSGLEGAGAGLRRALFSDADQLSVVAGDLREKVRAGERRVSVVGTNVNATIPRKGFVRLMYKPISSSTVEAVDIKES